MGLIEKGNPAVDCYAYLRSTVEQGLAAGRFRPELTDVDMLAQTFMSGMHGIVSLHIARGKDPWVKWRPVRRRAELMVDALIQGADGGEDDSGGRSPAEPATSRKLARREPPSHEGTHGHDLDCAENADGRSGQVFWADLWRRRSPRC